MAGEPLRHLLPESFPISQFILWPHFCPAFSRRPLVANLKLGISLDVGAWCLELLLELFLSPFASPGNLPRSRHASSSHQRRADA
jgi:hypothetical protein